MDGAVCDTHSMVWYLEDDARLSLKASECFENCRKAGRRVLVPSVCIVEIVYLIDKGRLDPGILDRLVQELAKANSALRLAPLDLAVARRVREVARAEVPDFPDRIIAATALHTQLPLISRDREIRNSAITTI